MRYFALLMLCWLAFACQPLKQSNEFTLADDTNTVEIGGAELLPISFTDVTPAHVVIAANYVGITETAHNTGPEIDRFLASVGLPAGNPWCAAFVSYTLEQADVESPSVRSGLASHFIKENSIDARKFNRGVYKPEPGDLLVWRRGNTIFGHLGIVESHEGKTLFTIEGNTSPGATGANGSGVFRRDRSVQPAAHFRITHFTNVRYATR